MGKADSLSGGAEACSNVAAVIDAMAILQLLKLESSSLKEQNKTKQIIWQE